MHLHISPSCKRGFQTTPGTQLVFPLNKASPCGLKCLVLVCLVVVDCCVWEIDFINIRDPYAELQEKTCDRKISFLFTAINTNKYIWMFFLLKTNAWVVFWKNPSGLRNNAEVHNVGTAKQLFGSEPKKKLNLSQSNKQDFFSFHVCELTMNWSRSIDLGGEMQLLRCASQILFLPKLGAQCSFQTWFSIYINSNIFFSNIGSA